MQSKREDVNKNIWSQQEENIHTRSLYGLKLKNIKFNMNERLFSTNKKGNSNQTQKVKKLKEVWKKLTRLQRGERASNFHTRRRKLHGMALGC